jgi:hypothetical protein
VAPERHRRVRPAASTADRPLVETTGSIAPRDRVEARKRSRGGNRGRARRTEVRQIEGKAQSRQAAWLGRDKKNSHRVGDVRPREALDITAKLNGHARDITEEKGNDSPQTPELPIGLYVEQRREQRRDASGGVAR